MPKYLVYGAYTGEGLKGVLKEGGSGRRDAVAQVIRGLGGTLEGFYYAFGDNDFYIVVEAPDNASVVAATMAANVSGAINAKTVALITPEEVDEAAKKTVNFRPPGQ